MGHERITGGRSITANKIENSWRQSCFRYALSEEKRGEGCLLRRFEDNGVAGSQAWPQVFRRNHGGKIPRGNDCPCADGNLESEEALVGVSRRNNGSFQALHIFGSYPKIFS